MSKLTTMSVKGRVTIPREIRKRLGLQAGDQIIWSTMSDGTVVMQPTARLLPDPMDVPRLPGQPAVAVDGQARRPLSRLFSQD